jgi:hypothetical protein
VSIFPIWQVTDQYSKLVYVYIYINSYVLYSKLFQLIYPSYHYKRRDDQVVESSTSVVGLRRTWRPCIWTLLVIGDPMKPGWFRWFNGLVC